MLSRSRSTQDHHLYRLGRPPIPDATFQVPRSLAFRFWRRRFLKVFTIYGHGGHLGHVTRTIWTNFRSPIPTSLHMKFDFNWPSGFRGDDVWKCWGKDDRLTFDGRQSHWYINSSHSSLRLRWAKKQRSKIATIKESVKSLLKFKPHSQGCHCVVSLSKTLYPLLCAGSRNLPSMT